MTGLKIAIIGTGYVGLVSGVCFAALGHKVTCIDNNDAKIASLQKGEVPIYEPGLDKLIGENIAAGRLHFSGDVAHSIKNSDAIFIAVGTPTAADGVSADLSYVFGVARQIAPHLDRYQIVVTKSTVPVSTNGQVEEIIHGVNPKADFDICSNPEFLREGNAIEDFMAPDRIVIGVRSARAHSVMEKLYAPLTERGITLMVTTPESAELIKYASNAFLATKVAFINEMADLAEAAGADIAEIAHGVGLDSRIGAKFLKAGPGYGGSCFPKDTRALAQIAREFNAPLRIVESVIDSNEKRKVKMAERIITLLGQDLSGKKIAVLGVTFKAGTNDMRESVSLDILPRLMAAGAEIHVHDPADDDEMRRILPQNIQWHEAPDAVFTGADAVILLTDWPEFKTLDFTAAIKNMRQRIMIDLRNFFDPAMMEKMGFSYHSIGRPPKTLFLQHKT